MPHLCTNGQTILSAFFRHIISTSSLRDVADGPHLPLECDGRHKCVIRICSAGSNTSQCVFLPTLLTHILNLGAGIARSV